MKPKPIKLIFVVVTILMVTSLISCKSIDMGRLDSSSNAISSTSIQLSSSDSAAEPTPNIPPTKTFVRLMAVGDNLIHSSIYDQAKARANGGGYDFSYSYKYIKSTIKKADISIINQETPIASIYPASTYPMFNSPTQLGDEVVRTGFDIINLANNHTMDKGATGLLSTLDFWAGKKKSSKVLSVGAYKNAKDRDTVRVKEVNGIKFGFVGFTEPTNGLSVPASSDAIWMLGRNEATIEKSVKAAKNASDFVVVSVHWGEEYTHVPNERQRYLAKKLVEWGADAIMGHHPHVIQPVEYLKKPSGGNALVVYSLGNFISAQDRAPRMVGGLLDYTVTKNHTSGKLSIGKVKFLPVITHYGSRFTNITTYPFSSYTKDLAASHGVKTYSPDFSYDYIKKLVSNVIDKKFL